MPAGIVPNTNKSPVAKLVLVMVAPVSDVLSTSLIMRLASTIGIGVPLAVKNVVV